MYSIGVKVQGKYTFSKPQTKKLKDLLEIVPKLNSVIVRFNANFTDEELYKWENNRWILIEEETKSE